MRLQVITFLILVLAVYPISFFLAAFLHLAPLANILGFIALVTYVITLLPSMLKVVFSNTKRNKFLSWLLKYRRAIGVASFCLGLNHGVLLIIRRNIDLLDWQVYIEYFQGFTILLIFTLLAVTSNNETVKSMKMNWKKLHKLTYLVIFLLPWHILDKMAGHWTYLTPFGVLLTTTLVVLFIKRKSLEEFSR